MHNIDTPQPKSFLIHFTFTLHLHSALSIQRKEKGKCISVGYGNTGYGVSSLGIQN